MLPPSQAADPYDVPGSPLKTRENRPNSSSSHWETVVAMPDQAERTVTTTDSSTQTDPKKKTNGVAETTPQPSGPTPKKTPTRADDNAGRADAPAAADEPGQPEEDANGVELEIVSLKSHRVDKENATVDFLVTWDTGEDSWESEWSLHTQVPELVFGYWDQYESREDATDLDIFHVFKILKRMSPSKGNQPKYLIQWVGYRRNEATWEPEDKVRLIAPEDLKAFEAKHGVATEVAGQKRRSGRGPGRPRKRARNSRD